jgi:hypothetical protein
LTDAHLEGAKKAEATPVVAVEPEPIGAQAVVVVAEQVAVHVVVVPPIVLVLQQSPGASGDHSRAVSGLHYRIGADGVVTEATNGIVRIPYAQVPVSGAADGCAVRVGRTAQLLDPVDYVVVRSAGAPPAMDDNDLGTNNRWAAGPARLYALGYREGWLADWSVDMKDADTDRAALDFDADHPPAHSDLDQRRRLGTLTRAMAALLVAEAGA